MALFAAWWSTLKTKNAIFILCWCRDKGMVVYTPLATASHKKKAGNNRLFFASFPHIALWMLLI